MEHRPSTPAPSKWNRIRRILVPTDFSDRAHKAMRYALDLARSFDAEVHLLHVIPPVEGDSISPLRYTPEAIAAHDTPDRVIYHLLESALAREEVGDVRVELVTQRGLRLAPAILRYVQHEAIDLIVLTTRGAQGVRYLFLGSTAAEVVHRATCSTLIVHENQPEAPFFDIRRLLVPVDFSAASIPLLQQAKHLAADGDAEIDLLHVIESPSFLAPLAGIATLYDLVPNLHRQAEARMQRLLDRTGGPDVPIRVHLREGRPASTIVDAADELGTDLLVIATRGLSGVARFLLGSTTERVVRAAPCPVLTVQPDEGPSDTIDEATLTEADEAG